MPQRTLLGFMGLAMALVALLTVAMSWALGSAQPPGAVATAFAEALPSGRLTTLATGSLLQSAEFRGALAAWRSRDRIQRLRVQQGPVYADTEAQSLSMAQVEVVTHYAEIYPGRKALNWEQDYALTLTRGLFGPWRVSGVRTTAQAVVQVLGGYSAQGRTHLVVPISVYLPQQHN